jgi:hypothetical protein
MTDWFSEMTGPEAAGPREKLSREMEHRGSFGSREIPAPTWNLAGGFRAGLADDPQTKMRQYARARFPGEANPERRYGIMGGEIVYRGDDGNFYRETGGIRSLPEAIAGGSLPAIGATAGGIYGGAAGAGLGGTIGESARKVLAGLLMDEPQTIEGNLLDIGTEGALSYGGWKLGDLAGRWRDAARARDITPAAEAEAQRVRGLSDRYLGKPEWVTPGEAGDIASLQRQQTMLNNSAGTPGDIMREYNRKRAEAVAQGVEGFIGPSQNPAVTGRQVSEAAKDEIKGAIEARTRAVTPAYTAARQSGAPVAGTDVLVQELERELQTAKGPVRASLAQARRLFYMPKPGKPGEMVLDDSVEGMHQAKIALDAMLEKQGDRAVDKTTKRLLQGTKTRLVDLLAQASPDYEAGRATFQAMSPPIEEMQKGILGVLQDTSPQGWVKLSKTIFSPQNANPADIATVRRMVERKDPGLWREFIKGYWRQTWELTRQDTLNAGGLWRTKMFGTPAAQNVWRAALGADDFKSLQGLMDVLQATSRVAKGQSGTHFFGVERGAQEVRAAPLLSGVRDVTRLDPLRMMIGRATDRLDETVAKIITSPEAMAQIRQLRGLSPASQKALDITGLALVRAGAGAVESTLEPPPPNQPPPPPGP